VNEGPLPTEVPPVDEVNQLTDEEDVALRVTVPFPQRDTSVAEGDAGDWFTTA